MVWTTSFELTIELPLSCEQSFDLFSDPEGLARAAGAPKVRGLSKLPATTGAEWSVKGGPIRVWTTRCLVTTSDRPHRRVTQLTGAVEATVEDRFMPVDGRTRVTRRYSIRRVPGPSSATHFRTAQQAYLRRVASYVERQSGSIHAGKTAALKRVKSSFAVKPSTAMKRRKQIEVDLYAEIAADPSEAFDTAVRQVDRYWQWMAYRSEPTVDYRVSPDWPNTGAQYTYRMRAKEPLNRWETGVCRVERCDPPRYALLAEAQRLRLFRNVVTIEWQLADLDGGTSLHARYEITALNPLINALTARTPESVVDGLREGIAKMIWRLEGEAGHWRDGEADEER